MSRKLHTSVQHLPTLWAIALYALFCGGAWAVMRLTSGSTLGILLGPVAAQGMMALVIMLASRTAFGGRVRVVRVAPAPRLRLRATPVVLIALGGFLLQASLIAGSRAVLPASMQAVPGTLIAASIPGLPEGLDIPLMWGVLIFTSVIGAPLLEEIFFRGMLLPLLARRHAMLGLVTSAGLFGLAHGFDVQFRMLPTFLEGLLLGALVVVTGRLTAAVAVHALNNALVVAATLVLTFAPKSFAGHVGGASTGSASIALYTLLAVGLVAWGFVSLRRGTAGRLPEPELAAASIG